MCPLVCFEKLVDLKVILHNIQFNDEADTLVWEGSVQQDELWVNVGGDHGGHSLKFSFQLMNVMHPNSLHSTIPFFVCESKDRPSSLSKTFPPYTEQIEAHQQTKRNGKQIKFLSLSLWR